MRAPTLDPSGTFLGPERAVAPAHWNRWLVPPAAIAIHLAIGQVYAWSVFKSPLEDTLDLTGLQSSLPFQLAIVVLGLSAAFGGALVERNGPRWAMFVSTTFFTSGFLISALGIATEQYWLVVGAYGLIGGIGLGIGYISPVSTLIKWFPDRPGLATGVAIMGFGGGAVIASPWSNQMMQAFGMDTSGIATTFLVHGVVYAVFMTVGVLLVRTPPEGWRPAGWQPEGDKAETETKVGDVSARNALRTPQFWLLWIVLCVNVTAGIGILERAAPMIRDFFEETANPVGVAAAAGFVALISLANMLGRIGWSSASDHIGRKNIYRLYLGVGALLYLTIALTTNLSQVIFVLSAVLILSFYGGGFATIPAYLKDMFGSFEVGAIHGRLLTAWSVAGVLGPLLINTIADARAGEQGPAIYLPAIYIMIGLLLVGFIANEAVRTVNSKYRETEEEERTSGGSTR